MDRWRRPRQGVEFSHLLLDGGKLYVPPGDETLFVNVIGAEIVKGARHHVVERRTKLFRLFFDLDAHLAVGASDVDWKKVVDILSAAVFGLFEVDRPSAIVARAPERAIKSGDETRRKLGFHVHFPGVRVTSPVASFARKVALEALEAAFPDSLANGWGACVDEAVFNGSGLRLPWQRKGPSAAPENVYAPWLELDDREWREVDAATILKSVKATRAVVSSCSIRCGPNESATALSSGKLSDEDLAALDSRDDGGAASCALVGAKHVSLSKFGDALAALQECMPPEYASQRFVACLEADTVFLLRSSSKYCQNVEREHGSSNVYFVLRPGGVSQHCYCRKSDTDGRVSGKCCKDFAGKVYPVPPIVTARFFGSKFVDDVPIAEHPDHGVQKTREIIAAQVERDAAETRKRVMPSALIRKNASTAGMMARLSAGAAKQTKKRKKS